MVMYDKTVLKQKHNELLDQIKSTLTEKIVITFKSKAGGVTVTAHLAVEDITKVYIVGKEDYTVSYLSSLRDQIVSDMLVEYKPFLTASTDFVDTVKRMDNLLSNKLNNRR